jgi:hypothetical protein
VSSPRVYWRGRIHPLGRIGGTGAEGFIHSEESVFACWFPPAAHSRGSAISTKSHEWTQRFRACEGEQIRFPTRFLRVKKTRFPSSFLNCLPRGLLSAGFTANPEFRQTRKQQLFPFTFTTRVCYTVSKRDLRDPASCL